MIEEELKIHGSIFLLLNKFIDHHLSYGIWDQLLSESGASDVAFDVKENYPMGLFESILNAAGKRINLNKNQLEEKFGEYLVPDLLISYAAFLKPEWKTFELLEHTETVMHHAVRQLNSAASPPILHIFKVDETLLVIDYYSKRKMSCLAIGIIKGIATFYNESDKIKILPATSPDDERVQIRVEFKN
ncbi:MAG TPA: heme NO-binding domain-containing protein, partial [Saprospiraceae bacterium]|nr:heme NO-binding domain-containing protein [Saprospiraceae bacterium]